MTDGRFLEAVPDAAQGVAYDSVESFVRDHVAVLVQRKLQGSVTWCPQWYLHPEAVDRLTALWRAWEELHDAPNAGLSRWWLNHADPHLAVLMDRLAGPFVYCSPDKGHSGRCGPLPWGPLT